MCCGFWKGKNGGRWKITTDPNTDWADGRTCTAPSEGLYGSVGVGYLPDSRIQVFAT